VEEVELLDMSERKSSGRSYGSSSGGYSSYSSGGGSHHVYETDDGDEGSRFPQGGQSVQCHQQ
jgi:hypothetical protein